MLDAFEILTTSGVVLWRRHYTADVSPHLINSLVSDVFIEDRQKAGSGSGSGMGVDGEVKGYRKERCMLKYTSAKEVGLCFVVGKTEDASAPWPSRVASRDGMQAGQWIEAEADETLLGGV